MLGIILIYFIGRRFYDLSTEYNKNKWVYAILSVVAYYVIGWILIFIWGFDWESSYGINLISLPAGLIGVWGMYILLEYKWKKAVVVIKDEINDIGKNIEDN